MTDTNTLTSSLTNPTALRGENRLTSDEEKKDEDTSEEEGQEALWIEVDTKPTTSPPRRSWSASTRSPPTTPVRTSKIILLQPPAPPPPPPAQSPQDISSLADKARSMLEEALQTSHSINQRRQKAQSAFTTALEARRLSDQDFDDALERLWQEARDKGVLAIEDDDDQETARDCLNLVLPCGKAAVPQDSPAVAAPPVPTNSDDISTLGFDNTFEEHSPLSMSSLNEILDAPTTPLAVTAAAEKPKTKRRRRWFRLVKPKAKVSKTKPAKLVEPVQREVQRFVATIVEPEEDDVLDGETKVELEQARALDQKLDGVLKTALAQADDESVTSWQGVPVHEERQTKKKTPKEPEGQRHVGPRQSFDQVQPQFVTAPRGAPAILMQKSWESLEEQGALPTAEDLQEQQQRAAQQEAQAKQKKKSKKKKKNDKAAVPPLDTDLSKGVDPFLMPLPSLSPASTGITGPDDEDDDEGRPEYEDRYVINPFVAEGEDKYKCLEMCAAFVDCGDSLASDDTAERIEQRRLAHAEVPEHRRLSEPPPVQRTRAEEDERPADDPMDDPEPEPERYAPLPEALQQQQQQLESDRAPVYTLPTAETDDSSNPVGPMPKPPTPKRSKTAETVEKKRFGLFGRRHSSDKSKKELDKGKKESPLRKLGRLSLKKPAPEVQGPSTTRIIKLQTKKVATPPRKDKRQVQQLAPIEDSPQRYQVPQEKLVHITVGENPAKLGATSEDSDTALTHSMTHVTDDSDSLLHMIKEQQKRRPRLDPGDVTEVRGIDP